MPIRKIPKTYGSLSGQIPSRKLNRSVAFESSLERDLLTLIEFDSNIIDYGEQPLTVEYVDANRKHRAYTPDILVIYRDESVSPFGVSHVLGEVKYRSDLFSKWKELKPKFKAARAYCQKRGWIFRIFTEVEIRTDYLKNAQFLLRYKESELSSEQNEIVLKTLSVLEFTNVSDLLDRLTHNNTARLQMIPHIWQLIANGKIHTDFDLRLTMKSRVWV